MRAMPMTDARKAFLQIHLCVVLWGFTAGIIARLFDFVVDA